MAVPINIQQNPSVSKWRGEHIKVGFGNWIKVADITRVVVSNDASGRLLTLTIRGNPPFIYRGIGIDHIKENLAKRGIGS